MERNYKTRFVGVHLSKRFSDFQECRDLRKILKGDFIMQYAYVLEIQPDEDGRSNQKVFQVIREMEIPEDNIYIDADRENRTELERLVHTLKEGDMLIIRSGIDLGEDLDDVYRDLFPTLTEIGVELFSCEEPYFCGYDYFKTMNGVLNFTYYFTAKKKQDGYQKALEEGRVGRPAKTDAVERAIKLYNSKMYTISQIETLTGVSKSTIYKYLKE